MVKKISIPILYLLTITLSANYVSTQTCDDTANYKPNSPYGKNLRLLLSTLPSKVTSHDGYFNGSVGQDRDTVYSTGLCTPGAELDACSNCIKTTSEAILQSCPNQTDAFSWLGDKLLCLVRYSSLSFSGKLLVEPFNVFHNVMEIRRENQKEFDSVWDKLMARLVTVASSSGKYYGKDVAPVPVYGNITVLMQCTRDISLKDCKVCLEASVEYYKTWFYGKRGSIVLRPSCFFRWELYNFSGAFDHINDLRSPPPPSISNNINKSEKDTRKRTTIIAVVVVVIVVGVILIVVGLVIVKRRKQKQKLELPMILNEAESIQFDLKTIEAATSNFSKRNKLGEGGFGEVYKGMLMNGTEVAVKRLSKTSGQGDVEFKNEVVVVAKLQHRNLVRLLGFSLQGDEKLLVYEFVPNKSLDYFLFDPNKRIQFDWIERRNIIWGITRGILYLHQDSRLKIIHRDLKASNILIDAEMNPKIADFGMARIFGTDQTVANTRRVVGTFGYMPPEYVTHGEFSTKSDVYSFGVLTLEIISGKKNSSFYQMDGLVNNLVTYVWRLWENKALPDLIDPCIKEDCNIDEVIRYIHIGLLCVQENPADRPTMSTIHQMLTTSSIALPVPLPPGFFFNNRPRSNQADSTQSTNKSITYSVDEDTITDVTPR